MAFVLKDLISGSAVVAPSGHAQSVVETPLVSDTLSENFSLIVACAGSVAGTSVAGFDALFTAIETALDTYVGTTLGLDTAGNSIDYNALISGIFNETTEALYLNDATRNYIVTGTIKIRVYAV